MNILTIKRVNIGKLGLITSLSTLSLFGCSVESESDASANDNTAASSVQNVSIAKGSKMWVGEPKGHVTHGDPTTDDVAFLVQLGRVQAAIGRANYHDKEKGMSNPFTAQVLSAYAKIDPFVTGKSKRSLSLQPLLSEMASPETFAVVMDSSRSAHTARNAISVKMSALISRVDGIVTERFPSVRASALAMSTLHREAGELLMTGLSDDGQVLDISKYRDALQLMEASHRLRVNKLAVCKRSQETIEQIKSRGPLGDLIDRLIIASASGKRGANAGDVFEAAETLAQLGASLPEDDKQICQ